MEPDWLRSFVVLVLIYCRYDRNYLKEIGIPDHLIEEFATKRETPGFPYYHPSENRVLDEPGQIKMNNLKLKGFQEANMSEEDILFLFNMFTNNPTE